MSNLVFGAEGYNTINVTQNSSMWYVTIASQMRDDWVYGEWATDMAAIGSFAQFIERAEAFFAKKEKELEEYMNLEEMKEKIIASMSYDFWWETFPAKHWNIWAEMVKDDLPQEHGICMAYAILAFRVSIWSKEWFAEAGLKRPTSREELIEMAYSAMGVNQLETSYRFNPAQLSSQTVGGSICVHQGRFVWYRYPEMGKRHPIVYRIDEYFPKQAAPLSLDELLKQEAQDMRDTISYQRYGGFELCTFSAE